MDYHLNWVVGALKKFTSEASTEVYCNKKSENRHLVEKNQQDIDLLVAFRSEEGVYHLIFLEAKMYSGWDKEQMRSKAERICLIHEELVKNQEQVDLHFCLVSGRDSNRPSTDGWPKKLLDNGEFRFLKLKLPSKRLNTTLWDAQRCKRSQDGEHFKVMESSYRTYGCH